MKGLRATSTWRMMIGSVMLLVVAVVGLVAYNLLYGRNTAEVASAEGNLGADGGHLHSIYRDPTNEYGAAMVSQ